MTKEQAAQMIAMDTYIRNALLVIIIILVTIAAINLMDVITK
jgi:hypothetical protein